MVKESLEELAHAEYWDKRYAEKNEDSFDWLRTFSNTRLFLKKHLPAPAGETAPKILQLGCGNSTLSKDLYDAGWKAQTNIDFSPVVISTMQEKHPEMEWLVMDVRKLEFPDAGFDVAIDKATLDAMLYGSLWDPPEEVRANVKAYVDEVARILKPGHKWLYITWRQPHFIKPLLQRPDVWDMEVETLADGGGMFEYFGFVMMKAA